MSGRRPHREVVLAVILVGYLLILIDVSILMAALPRIHRDLGFSPTSLSWAQNAYTLTFGGLLLLGARIGDLAGRRRTFVVGIALFAAASLAVGVAQSPSWMIAARAVQGIGAAILAPRRSRCCRPAFLKEHSAHGRWRRTGLAFLPVTAAAFAAAAATSRFARLVGNDLLAIAGCGAMLIGTAWMSRVSVGTGYLTGIALPMIVFGIGQGFGLSALTTAGMAGVAPQDAGVAGGLVNVAHHLGGALGLGVLVTVFAAAGSPGQGTRGLLAERVSASLTAATAFLALAVIVTIIARRRTRDSPEQDSASAPDRGARERRPRQAIAETCAAA